MTPGDFSAKVRELLGRHERVALQFSGGKDSLACLYLLREFLGRIHVYWLNSGDALPETLEVVEACRPWIPHFYEVRSDVGAWRLENGMPSDLVPTFSTPLGRLMGFGQVKIADRFDCCWSNVMLPIHQRMKKDGVTCIIRGTKLADMPKLPRKSGDVVDGFELFYPIEKWSHAEVLGFLRAQGAPVHACYEDGSTGVDCAHCTAWWNEGHFEFIRKRHPELHEEVMGNVHAIVRAVETQLQDLRRVVGIE